MVYAGSNISLHLNCSLSQVVDVLSIGLSGFLRIDSLIPMKQALMQSVSLNIQHLEKSLKASFCSKFHRK